MTVGRVHRWPRRHAWGLFWLLTAPLVFQATYAVLDGSSGGIDSTAALWVTFLMTQFGYALLLIGLRRLTGAYWDWIDRL
jgi:hypothetical protein